MHAASIEHRPADDFITRVSDSVQFENAVQIASDNMDRALDRIVQQSVYDVSSQEVLTALSKSDKYKADFLTIQKDVASV